MAGVFGGFIATVEGGGWSVFTGPVILALPPEKLKDVWHIVCYLWLADWEPIAEVCCGEQSFDWSLQVSDWLHTVAPPILGFMEHEGRDPNRCTCLLLSVEVAHKLYSSCVLSSRQVCWFGHSSTAEDLHQEVREEEVVRRNSGQTTSGQEDHVDEMVKDLEQVF